MVLVFDYIFVEARGAHPKITIHTPNTWASCRNDARVASGMISLVMMAHNAAPGSPGAGRARLTFTFFFVTFSAQTCTGEA